MNESVFTEDHSVIEGIVETNKLNNETKLLALTEILRMEANDKLWSDAKYADDVDELFEWEESELGSKFWSNIQDKVFEFEKRTC